MGTGLAIHKLVKKLILILIAFGFPVFAHAGENCKSVLDTDKKLIQPSEPSAFLQRDPQQTKRIKLSKTILGQIDKITEAPAAVTDAEFIATLKEFIPPGADLRIYFKPGLGGEARLSFRRTKDDKWSVAGSVMGASNRIDFRNKYDSTSRLNEETRSYSGSRYIRDEDSRLNTSTDQLVKATHDLLRPLYQDLLEGELTVNFFEEATLWKRRFIRFEEAAFWEQEILFQTFAKVKGYRIVLSKMGLQPGGTQLTPQEEKFAATVYFLIQNKLGLEATREWTNVYKPRIVPHYQLFEGFDVNGYSLETDLYAAMEAYGLVYENGVWKKKGT